MKGNHKKAPILEAIEKYRNSGITPFTTPGHKMGEALQPEDLEFIGPLTFRNDISMQNGADDRRESKGVQEEAEELAAEAVGADTTYFSTNGSSMSSHVAILTVADAGEKILVSRNTHKSMIAALVMAGVEPVFLTPAIDEELDVEHGITPEHLDDMLKIHPEAKAVFVVSPTYYGVTSDIKARRSFATSARSRSSWTRPGARIFPFIPSCRPLPSPAERIFPLAASTKR